MNRAVVASGMLLHLVVASCSDASTDSTATSEVTDSAGVRIAFTRLGPDAPACRAGGENVRIGSANGEDGTPLFDVNDVAILGDGRIVIVNRGTSQIKVFSQSGAPVGEFGRQGGGPDEFRNLWSVDVRGDDTLVVGDYRPWRFTFFTPDGTLIRRVELKPPEIERPNFAIPLEAGAGFVMEQPHVEAQDEMVDRVVPLRLYGEDGVLRGAVGNFWLDRFGFLAKDIGYAGNPIFGARASFSHLRDDLILYGTGRYEQLEIWNTAGRLQRIVRWQSRERVVSPNDPDVWRRQRRNEIEARFEITPAMQPAIDAQIGDHLPVADLYPGHDRVVVTKEGDIWIQEYRRPLDDGPDRWWVFDTEGRFICSASLPTDFLMMAVANDRVVGVARDSLDVEYVVGYDVEYPTARIPLESR